MKQILQTAIIGGGASGLLCACELVSGEDKLRGNQIVILERLDRVGKKLIATGNGQGNLTNVSLRPENYYGDENFINVFLSETAKIDLRSYFYGLGIPLITQGEKVYPLSKQANSVLDTLRSYLESKDVKTMTDFYVTDVKKQDGVYKITSANGVVYAKTVVIAVGGASGKQFGTDGSSYVLAEKLGHDRTKIYPALVQIKTDTTLIKSLKGIKEQAVVTAYDGTAKLKTAVGEVLFTEYGLSGNAIFQISGHFAKAKNPKVKIEFLPDLSLEQTEKIVADRLKNAPQVAQIDILSGILAKRVGQTIIKTCKDLSPKTISTAIKNFILNVTGTLGFNFAQVTKGGIETTCINPYTYESKLSRGAYITGEALDIDGDCGGYNLTFAFTSGIASARAIKKNIKGV